MDKATVITIPREIKALYNDQYMEADGHQPTAENAQHIPAVLSAPSSPLASAMEAQYHEAGYEPWHHDIDAQVCSESACEACNAKGLRYIGLQKGSSRIAMAHWDVCGRELDF